MTYLYCSYNRNKASLRAAIKHLGFRRPRCLSMHVPSWLLPPAASCFITDMPCTEQQQHPPRKGSDVFALTWFPASPFSKVDFTAHIFLTVMLVTIHYLVYVIDVSSTEINAVLYCYRGLLMKNARNTLQDEVTRALCCKYPLQSTHRRNSLQLILV